MNFSTEISSPPPHFSVVKKMFFHTVRKKLSDHEVTRVARWYYFHTSLLPNFGIFGIEIGIGVQNFDSFYNHLVYFVAIWFILCHLDVFCGSLLYFPNFGIMSQEKSGNPGGNRNFVLIAKRIIKRTTLVSGKGAEQCDRLRLSKQTKIFTAAKNRFLTPPFKLFREKKSSEIYFRKFLGFKNFLQFVKA
jgi:hypothetical protein